MKTLKIEIEIPYSDHRDIDVVGTLDALETVLDEAFQAVDDFEDDCVTVADKLGFGGNTLMISSGDEIREICL
jgi:hypothetical protein